MNLRETTKLFYNEYAFKLVVKNALGHIFRDKNYKYARSVLDSLQLQYEKGKPLEVGTWVSRPIEEATFLEARNLLSRFVAKKDIKLRVENPKLIIYSNDITWLKYISTLVRFPTELWSPTAPIPKNTIILTRKLPFDYRVTFMEDQIDSNLANWIIKNQDKARAGKVALERIHFGWGVKGLYFYVRDEKVLALISLMLGHSCRVDKIITRQDIDK